MDVEETPIIDPLTQQSNTFTSSEPSSDVPPVNPVSESPTHTFPKRSGGIFKTLVLLVILFAVGYWLSGYVRQFLGSVTLPTSKTSSTPVNEEGTQLTNQTTPSAASASGLTSISWKAYQPMNGKTRETDNNVSFQLPENILSPICDNTACSSQGTYLPGGTRFTVALRGPDQVLPDYRGKLISDVSGKTFTVKDTTVKGYKAAEFSGSFTGSTVSGYAFTQMRGVMIELTADTSLEINHFAPSGITADFASDDVLFDQILNTLQLTPATEKGAVIPSITTAPTC